MDHTAVPGKENDYSKGHLINPGDPVPNVMGLNGVHLNPIQTGKEFGGSLLNVPKLGDEKNSPHSTYLCPANSDFCGYNGFEKLEQLQQQPIQQ